MATTTPSTSLGRVPDTPHHQAHRATTECDRSWAAARAPSAFLPKLTTSSKQVAMASPARQRQGPYPGNSPFCQEAPQRTARHLPALESAPRHLTTLTTEQGDMGTAVTSTPTAVWALRIGRETVEHEARTARHATYIVATCIAGAAR
jgi:hypothetical protein